MKNNPPHTHTQNPCLKDIEELGIFKHDLFDLLVRHPAKTSCFANTSYLSLVLCCTEHEPLFNSSHSQVIFSA